MIYAGSIDLTSQYRLEKPKTLWLLLVVLVVLVLLVPPPTRLCLSCLFVSICLYATHDRVRDRFARTAKIVLTITNCNVVDKTVIEYHMWTGYFTIGAKVSLPLQPNIYIV